MNRITFQFVPERTYNNIDPLSYLEDKNEFESSKQLESGFSVLRLDDSNWLEIGSRGDIRYTTKEFDNYDLSITEIFDDALSVIGDMLIDSSTDYRICLLIGNSDPVDTYLSNRNTIEQFGKEEFNDGDPSYTELNKSLVKLTFQRKPSPISQSVDQRAY